MSEACFDHDAHPSVELVCPVWLASVRVDPHDHRATSTRDEMARALARGGMEDVQVLFLETAQRVLRRSGTKSSTCEVAKRLRRFGHVRVDSIEMGHRSVVICRTWPSTASSGTTRMVVRNVRGSPKNRLSLSRWCSPPQEISFG